MSYILEALKRADAERERGHVPGLRAQPMPTASAHAPRGNNPLKRWLLFAIALIVALLATIAWRMGARAPQPEMQTAATPPAPVAAPAPAPAQAVALSPAPAPPPATRPTPKTPAPPAVVAAPSKRAPAVVPEARLPSFAELPEDIKRQIPTLAISGSIYSDNPGQRMLTIGSQVFQQGDKPAPDLVLEQIGRKAAIFSFRGTRYSVAY